METFSDTKCLLFALLTLRNRREGQTDLPCGGILKKWKKEKLNSLNNLYLLQLPSRVWSDDFHMDCAAACCSQGQFAGGGGLLSTCQHPSTPQLSALPCSSWPGCLWQEEEDDEAGAGRRSPQHWPLCELLGAVKLWELIAKLCFTKLTHIIDSQGQDLYLLSFQGVRKHFSHSISCLLVFLNEIRRWRKEPLPSVFSA